MYLTSSGTFRQVTNFNIVHFPSNCLAHIVLIPTDFTAATCFGSKPQPSSCSHTCMKTRAECCTGCELRMFKYLYISVSFHWYAVAQLKILLKLWHKRSVQIVYKYLVMRDSSRRRNLQTTKYFCVKRALQLLTDPLVACQNSVASFLTT